MKLSKNLKKKRSLSRLMAVQILYQNDFFAGEKTIAEIKKDLIENYTLNDDEEPTSYHEKIDEEFLENLLTGSTLDCEGIDGEVAYLIKDGWNLDRLDEILLQILRLGTFELKFVRDIPAKVIIDEYVDITSAFFSDKRLTFANATLDSLAKKLRAEEFLKKA